MLAKFIDKISPDMIFPFISNLIGNRNNLIVLAYHRIFDIDDNFKYDDELISASKEQFDEQMKFIKKYFCPISMEDVVEACESRKELPENSVLVTFDDGFEDNYTNAFPILKKHNVPATIFISASYINSDDTLWFDKLAYVIKNSKSEYIESETLNLKISLDSNQNRKQTLKKVLESLKKIPNQKRLDALDEIFNAEKDLLSNRDTTQSSTLSWDQVKEMDKSCISFGSHTLTHPILSQLNSEELNNELSLSKKIIEENLSHPIDTIAYPVGTKSAFNQQVIQMAKTSGYKLGFSYVTGINSWPCKASHELQRLHVERYTSFSMFKCMISMPNIFNY